MFSAVPDGTECFFTAYPAMPSSMAGRYSPPPPPPHPPSDVLPDASKSVRLDTE